MRINLAITVVILAFDPRVFIRISAAEDDIPPATASNYALHGRHLTCVDVDNGAADANGATCADYTAGTAGTCGGADDGDFVSSTVCCACGGGVTTLPPSILPTSSPTPVPSPLPTSVPTGAPTPTPTPLPTSIPTGDPTPTPTPLPTSVPTGAPTPTPTPLPTSVPTGAPTPTPTPPPTSVPTGSPTSTPTPPPTSVPTGSPTLEPTPAPTVPPTGAPTPTPTPLPTSVPTGNPTPTPTVPPTSAPTGAPTPTPTPLPSVRRETFTWKPDNITITATTSNSSRCKNGSSVYSNGDEDNGGGSYDDDEYWNGRQAAEGSGMGRTSRHYASGVCGNVTVALRANHRVLPAEHQNWGHYALVVANQSTQCLDWHASEEDVSAALNALPAVAARGGLTVATTTGVSARGQPQSWSSALPSTQSHHPHGHPGARYGYMHSLSMVKPEQQAWLEGKRAGPGPTDAPAYDPSSDQGALGDGSGGGGVRVSRRSHVASSSVAAAAAEASMVRPLGGGGPGTAGVGAVGGGVSRVVPGSLFERYASVPCDPVWTWGEWDDPTQWQHGVVTADTRDLYGTVPGASLKAGWQASADKPSAKTSMNSLLENLLPPDSDDGDDDDDDDLLEDAEKAEDEVVLPQGSGFIQLTRSLVLKRLVQLGGTLVTAESGCPSGWGKPQHASEAYAGTRRPRFGGVRAKGEFAPSSNGDGDEEDEEDEGGAQSYPVPKRQTKCFAAFRGPPPPPRHTPDHHHPGLRSTEDRRAGLDHEAAGAFCAALSPGARGRLARIESFSENEAVKGLCQGLATEPLERGPGDALAEAAVREAQGKGLHRGDGDLHGAGVRQRAASQFLGDEGTVALAQARDPACWIGLRRGRVHAASAAHTQMGEGVPAGSGPPSNRRGAYSNAGSDEHWSWEGERDMGSVAWRAWARGQPDNATSDGGGEGCAAMAPSLYSVERQHLGLWTDERCGSRLAFVCERFAETSGHTLFVAANFEWAGGALSGPGTVRVLGNTTLKGGGGGQQENQWNDGFASFPSGQTAASSYEGGDGVSGFGGHGFRDDDDGGGVGEAQGMATAQQEAAAKQGGGWAALPWRQAHGVMGPGLTDGARLELWGDARVLDDTVLNGGDGAVLAILAPRHRTSNNGSTALRLGGNVTFRAVQGGGPSWRLPPDPPAVSASAAARLSQQARAAAATATTRAEARGSGAAKGGAGGRTGLLNEVYAARAAATAMAPFAAESATDSPMRGVFYMSSKKKSQSGGSGASSGSSRHPRVAAATPGLGRRARVLNRGVVLFPGEVGPSQVEWYYEAGGQGVGDGVNGSTLQYGANNASGVLVANSSRFDLTLAGGGLATGGSSFVITAGRNLRTGQHKGGSNSSGGGHPGGPTAVGVVASNFTLALAAPPTFLLRLSAERRVAGEERDWGDTIAPELERNARAKPSGSTYPDPTDAESSANHERHYGTNGTYRLAVRFPSWLQAAGGEAAQASHGYYDNGGGGKTLVNDGAAELTSCISYHAPAHVLEAVLLELASVRALGGATVVRDGDEASPRWGFGYSYRITFDAAEALAKGGLAAPSGSSRGGWGSSAVGGGVGGGGRFGSDSSGGGTSDGPWAWDLENGLMSDGVPSWALNGQGEDGGDGAWEGVGSGDAASSFGHGRNGTGGGAGADVFVACQGASGGCGCAEVVARTDPTALASGREGRAANNNDDRRRTLEGDLPSGVSRGTGATFSDDQETVQHFCRSRERSGGEDPFVCTLSPRITMASLHGGGEARVGDGVERHDSTLGGSGFYDQETGWGFNDLGGVSGGKATNKDDLDLEKSESWGYYASSSAFGSLDASTPDGFDAFGNPRLSNGVKGFGPTSARFLGVPCPAVSVTGGVHRLPSVLGGAVGLLVRGGSAAVLAADFSAAFAIVGRNASAAADPGGAGSTASGLGRATTEGAGTTWDAWAAAGGGSSGGGWSRSAEEGGGVSYGAGGANGTAGLGLLGGGRGGGGLLVCGGAGFTGLDNAQLLYEPGHRKGRASLVHSPFNGFIGGPLSVFGGGEVRVCTMDHKQSGLSAHEVHVGSGGLLSGWATVRARKVMALDGDGAKRLRTALKLECSRACRGSWTGSGAVWLSEGASVVNKGKLRFSPRARDEGAGLGFDGYGGDLRPGSDYDEATAAAAVAWATRAGSAESDGAGFGPHNSYGGGSDGYGGGGSMGALTLGDVDMGWAASRQGWAPGQQWAEGSAATEGGRGGGGTGRVHGLRRGFWYENPVCGPHCARAPFLFVGEGAQLVVTTGARPRVGLTVRMVGSCEVQDSARLTLGGGGDGDGSWALGGTLRLSGGRYVMEGSSDLRGLSQRNDVEDWGDDDAFNSTDTQNPTRAPSLPPTSAPSEGPTPAPTGVPTPPPTVTPSHAPTLSPTSGHSPNPTQRPTHAPTPVPTIEPSSQPTQTAKPSATPTPQPSSDPTPQPTCVGECGGLNGTVEVTGGGAHQLSDVLNGPRLVLLGGSVEVRSRYHELGGGLAIHGQALLKYTVASCRAFVGGDNFTMTGGALEFVQVLPFAAIHPSHIHSEARNADRSFMTVTSELQWSGGTMRGNAEVACRVGMRVGMERSPLAHAAPWATRRGAYADQTDPASRTQAQEIARVFGAGSAAGVGGAMHGRLAEELAAGLATPQAAEWAAQGGGYRVKGGGGPLLGDLLPLFAQPPLRLESLLHLVSFGRSRWFGSDVVVSGGASLVEAGVVWMEGPRGHTARVQQEPVPGERSRRSKRLTVWEDNEASWHQDLGGWA